MANPYLVGTIQIPSALEVTAITQSYPMVITVAVNPVTQDNAYREGQLVKFTIPFGYGMQQANGMIAKITSVDDDEITLNVDSSNFDPFSEPVSGLKPASISPYGSRNLEYSNTTNHIAFQSLNNMGN